MKVKLLLLLLPVFFTGVTSFIGKPAGNWIPAKKSFCAAYFHDAINASYDATITNITVLDPLCGNNLWSYTPDILPFNTADVSASPDCGIMTVRANISGPFSTVSIVSYGGSYVYDQLSYDPNGTGLYSFTVEFGCIHFDLVVL